MNEMAHKSLKLQLFYPAPLYFPERLFSTVYILNINQALIFSSADSEVWLLGDDFLSKRPNFKYNAKLKKKYQTASFCGLVILLKDINQMDCILQNTTIILEEQGM